MSETDIIAVASPLPAIARVSAHDAYTVTVTWESGERTGDVTLIDLAPAILTHKVFKPLRDNPRLFRTVHVTAMGSAIAWGEDDAIDMAATTLERLADEIMSTEDFKTFLVRRGLTFDAAAGQLGISRRLVAYYAKGRSIPRYIGLACAYLDHQAEMRSVADRVLSSDRKTTFSEDEDTPTMRATRSRS